MRIPVPDEIPAADQLGRVHFVGIGGAALSGIARIMAQRGLPVTGSDEQETPFLPALRELGVTVRRGYDADHPRIELLRHKQLLAGKSYGFADFIHTAELADHVRAYWRALKPLVSLLERAFAAAE